MGITERELRAAQNQMLFRSVNDRVREVSDKVISAVSEIDFACECDDISCLGTISLEVSEFRSIEATENRFIVLPGHEDDAVEDVVETREGFVIVAKRGAGAEFVNEHS
jgi:hypothetical protein